MGEYKRIFLLANNPDVNNIINKINFNDSDLVITFRAGFSKTNVIKNIKK